MKMRHIFVILLAVLLATSSSAFGQNSQYGKLLYSGPYTLTGQGIKNMQVINTGVVSVHQVQIYEKMFIFGSDSYNYYVGDQVLFNVNYRKYTGSADNIALYVDPSGGVLLAVSDTQFVPFVGNVTTVIYSIMSPGNLLAQQQLGGYGNGSIGGGAGGNVCVICGGSGNCTNPRSANNYKEYCQGRRTCANCGGTGHVLAGFGQSGYVPCSYCNRRVNANYGDGICGRCHGTGRCHHCNGTGYR